jgi:multiple sugar transport system substrate-binding protein
LLLFITLLVGCSRASAPGATSETAAVSTSAPAAAVSTSAPTTNISLTYAFPDDAASTAVATQLVQAYSFANPDVDIALQPLPAKEYAQQLLNTTGGTPPDIFVSADTHVPALLEQNRLLDLQTFLTQDRSPAMDDFQRTTLAPWQRNDALYGLPTDAVPMVLFYNRDLFDAYSLAYPTADWTWNDWLTNAQTLTAVSSDRVRFGTAIPGWAVMIWGNGGELLTADNTQSLLEQPAAAEGVQFAADMVSVHKVAPPPKSSGGPDATQLFKDQQAALLPAPSSFIGELRQADVVFDWGIAPMPTGKMPASVMNVTGLSISAQSQRPQAAFDFVAWAAGSAGQAIRAEVVPFAASALRNATPRPSDVDGVEAIIEALEYGRTLPQTPHWPKISEYVSQELKPVWQGQETAVAAYSRMTPRINSMLAAG